MMALRETSRSAPAIPRRAKQIFRSALPSQMDNVCGFVDFFICSAVPPSPRFQHAPGGHILFVPVA
jgi:hypothetical protein